jgi:hypothetical protein
MVISVDGFPQSFKVLGRTFDNLTARDTADTQIGVGIAQRDGIDRSTFQSGYEGSVVECGHSVAPDEYKKSPS